MKKINFFMMAMMIAVSTICVFTMSSCSDDDDDNKTCTCTETGAGYSASRQLDPKSYGVTNCSDLEVKLRIAAASVNEYNYNCY